MLLIRGGCLLQEDATALETADILVERDRITSIGRDLAIPGGARIIDARDRIVVPGLINCHTHAHNNLLKGIEDNRTLEEARAYGPAIYANRTPQDQYVSAAIGAIEMLKTGCTAAFDMFTAMPAMTSESVEAVVRAYADVGLRAVLAPSMNDGAFYRAVPGLLDLLPSDLRGIVESVQANPASALIDMAESAVKQWDGFGDGRIHIGVAPVVPGECSDGYLAAMIDLARRYGLRLQTHLAETKMQAIYGIERWGQPLVQHLAKIGLIGSHFVGGHGVWMTEDEIKIMADTGASVAHNPASNLRLGSGIAPVREMLDLALTVGLGCDGSMSSDNQNMYEAMRIAALVNKVRFPHDPERWLGAHSIWQMATKNAARVLGLEDQIGGIAPGRKADLVLLRADSPFLRPVNSILSSLVYSETGADVDTVVVDGRVVVEAGRVTSVDESKLRSQAQNAADRLRAHADESRLLADRIRPFLRAACRSCAARAFSVNRYAVPVESSVR